MADVRVKTDSGSYILYKNVPDDMGADDFLREVGRTYQEGITEIERLPTAGDQVLDRVKDVGRTALKVGAATADMLNLPAAVQKGKPFEFPFSQAVDANMPEGLRGSPLDNGYPRAVTQGVTGAVMSGVGGLPRRIITGAMAGGGEQAARDAFPGNKWAPIAGNVAGTAPGTLFPQIPSNASKVARNALSGTLPQDLDSAELNMAAAARQGASVNASQAMPARSNIDDLVADLAKSNPTVVNQLRGQPGYLAQRGQQELGQLPGNIMSPSDVNRQATGLMQVLRSKDVSNLWIAQQQMQTVAPQVFVGAVKTQLAQQFRSALGNSPSGPANVGAAIQRSFDPAFTQQMLAAVARTMGVPEHEIANGFMNFLHISDMMAKQPAVATTFNAAASRSSVIGAVSDAVNIQRPIGALVGDPFRAFLKANTDRVISKAVTSPEGIQMLRQLAKQNALTKSAQNAVAGFYASLASDPITEE